MMDLSTAWGGGCNNNLDTAITQRLDSWHPNITLKKRHNFSMGHVCASLQLWSGRGIQLSLIHI